jgi:hypothetical protein
MNLDHKDKICFLDDACQTITAIADRLWSLDSEFDRLPESEERAIALYDAERLRYWKMLSDKRTKLVEGILDALGNDPDMNGYVSSRILYSLANDITGVYADIRNFQAKLTALDADLYREKGCNDETKALQEEF